MRTNHGEGAISVFDRWRAHQRAADKGAGDMRLVEHEEQKGSVLARYLLRGRWWMWAEVVVLRGGHLLVHGDIDAVIFGGCHGHTTPRHVLQWMAFAGPDYAREKAAIGSSNKIAEEFDRNVAMWRVLDWRRTDPETISKGDARMLYDGLRWGWEQHEFIEHLSLVKEDSEGFDMGETTAPAVFNAQGVLRRLLFQLEALDYRSAARDWFRRTDPAPTVSA